MKNLILFIILIFTITSCVNKNFSNKNEPNIEYSGSAVFRIGD